MQREAAKKLIRDTFEQPFNKDQFAVFAKNLLNHMESAPFPRPRTGQMIFEDFRSHIASFDRIGKYTDSDGNKLDVLVVNLSKTSSVDRARATQRKFVAKYLKESQGAQLKDAALVAFVSPNEEDWRFSFVKMDYKIETTDKGRVKVKEEFTPARRYSFLVGQNENSHTAQSQLLPILEDTDHDPTIKSIEERFSIEKVTKEFFEQYRELYHKVKDALDKLVSKDKEIRADFESKGVDTVDFAKKLLGQIVFLYFLQKKGWFGVKRKAAWGTGSKGFLRELFRSKHGTYTNFFDDILEPLFYNTLAVERPENYADRFDCKIPFLNGGLFDPLNNYDWVNTDILLPNDLFSNEEKTRQGDTGTGILDVFDRYNFTVKEDEPLEKEVAVDPEMLGKVFENLLEVKDRKSKGTYYTPREIVHYMCQESLIDYLATELDGSVPREDIETLIKFGETAQENDTLVSERGEERGRYKYKLPESIRDQAQPIDDKLANIKVCDPAVGSGAFLVGMMSEIVRTRVVLTQFLGNGDRSTYDLKRHAIQNSLYGVDIDLGAVEIAKLRLWLSLIVDEYNYRNIKPLPNLDYKIVCGDSLMGLGNDLFNEPLFRKLEESKQQLVEERSPSRRRQLRSEISSAVSKLLSDKVPFDFRVMFSEVFFSNRGFDISIGNPPYGLINKRQNQQLGHVTDPSVLKRLKADPLYKPALGGMINVFRLFIAKSFDILKKNGVFCEIFPLAFIADVSAANLRKFCLFENKILAIEAFPERDNERKRVFAHAKMSVCILLAEKSSVGTKEFALRINGDKFVEESIEPTRIDREALLKCEPAHATIPLATQDRFDLLVKLFSGSRRLSELAHCYTGEVDLTIHKKYLSDDPSDKILVKGAAIGRFVLRQSMSQGEVKYLKERPFLQAVSGPKSSHH